MVETILTGIARTGEGYERHCRVVWIMALCLGFSFALIGNTGLIITCVIIGIPAYLLYQGKKTTKRTKK